MSREFGKVLARFWDDYAHLSGDAQRVAVYLFSCKHGNLHGLFRVPLEYLQGDLGLPWEGASKALAEVVGEGLIEYDETSGFVFVRGSAAEYYGRSLKPNDKRRTGLISRLREQKNHPFLQAFVEKYGKAYGLPKDLATGLASPSEAPYEAPYPPPSEDRDRDRDREGESLAAPAGSDATALAHLRDVIASHLESATSRPAPKLSAAALRDVLPRVRSVARIHGCDFDVAAQRLASAALALSREKGKEFVWALQDVLDVPKPTPAAADPFAVVRAAMAKDTDSRAEKGATRPSKPENEQGWPQGVTGAGNG